MNIEQAIKHSISHTEIATCEATRAELDALLQRADFNADLTAQYGYWDVCGLDDEGDEYRVYVTVVQ